LPQAPHIDVAIFARDLLRQVVTRIYFPDELEMHVRAALRNGPTQDEIKEVLLRSAIYCGVPAAE
jgi:alkylhydroperoxidase/carboxymuconolactone decarboxylase family protein YurZ